MEWNYCLTFIVLLGVFFFFSCLIAFLWAVRQGQFSAFEEQAKVIFTDEEPQGAHSDYFPKN
jgi:cbb3-type cytochrome oxidase maturation protein